MVGAHSHARDEEDLVWRRSARCSSSTCPEVAVTRQRVYLRDAKHPDLVQVYSYAEWGDFVAG
jgi:hypothetical protein